jgi:hypothetical protein
MKLAGALLAVAILATASASASAESDPGWFAGHSAEDRQALVDYAYERSGLGEAPYGGEAETLGEQVADDVVATGTDELPLAGELGAEELTTLEGAELLAPLEVLAPELIVAAGVLTAGVTIVNGVHSEFMRLAAPDDADGGANWAWDEVSWHDGGEEILFGARVQQSPGAYLYDSHDGAGVIRWFERPCDFSGFTPAAGAHMEVGVASTAACREWVEGVGPVDFPVFVDYPYLLASDVTPVAPLRPYHSETDEPDHFVSPETDPGTEVVEEGLRALDDDGNELLRDELDWSITPGSQKKEEPASNGTKVTAEDRACKAWFEEAPAADPGVRSPEAEPEAADWDYDVDEFEGVYNPLTRSTQTVKLRWGTQEWGYRHIVIRHGWNVATRARTALALQDRAPRPDRTPRSFIYRADLAEGPSGIRCRQRVIVSYGESRRIPGGRHIITSFLEGE